MAKGYGLVGAHRTGKTTIAQNLPVKFIQTSLSDIFISLRLVPSMVYDLPTTIGIQEKILDLSIQKWSQAETDFVSDRTPIDFIAYTLARTRQDQDNSAIGDYIQRCLEAHQTYFDKVVHIPPAIQIVDAPGKASTDPVFIKYIDTLIRGTLHHVNHVSMPVSMVDLSERVKYCSKYFLEH